MANTLTITAEISFSPDATDQSDIGPVTLTKAITCTGGDVTHGTQSIGTSEEAVTVCADVGTYGYVLVRNLDSTNYVELTTIASQLTMKLKAGEFALFRAAADAFRAKANTAAVTIEYWVFED